VLGPSALEAKLLRLSAIQIYVYFTFTVTDVSAIIVSVCVCVFVVLRVSDVDLYRGAGDRYLCLRLRNQGLNT